MEYRDANRHYAFVFQPQTYRPTTLVPNGNQIHQATVIDMNSPLLKMAGQSQD